MINRSGLLLSTLQYDFKGNFPYDDFFRKTHARLYLIKTGKSTRSTFSESTRSAFQMAIHQTKSKLRSRLILEGAELISGFPNKG